MEFFQSDMELVNKAQEIAQRMRNVKTHQLRRIYSEIYSIYKQSKEDVSTAKSRMILLMPQIAYAESRNRGLRSLTYELNKMIYQVDKGSNTKNKIKEIFLFVQSIIGYHKEGGK